MKNSLLMIEATNDDRSQTSAPVNPLDGRLMCAVPCHTEGAFRVPHLTHQYCKVTLGQSAWAIPDQWDSYMPKLSRQSKLRRDATGAQLSLLADQAQRLSGGNRCWGGATPRQILSSAVRGNSGGNPRLSRLGVSAHYSSTATSIPAKPNRCMS